MPVRTRSRGAAGASGVFPSLWRWAATAVSAAIPLVFLLLQQLPVTVHAVDIVAILPDRSTAYPNGVHNGLWLSAKRLNLTLDVRSVGNFDPDTSYQVLSEAIDTPPEDQPTIYCIWPIDLPSRQLMQELVRKHNHTVPIIQMNQLPSATTQWEWDHLLAYAGPDDALRARNAGIMLQTALKNQQQQQQQSSSSESEEEQTVFHVAALGYPETYAGYGLSIDSFARSLQGSSLQIVEQLPLDWGTQPAYEAVLQLFDTYIPAPQHAGTTSSTSTNSTTTTRPILDGIYAMDDSILMGVYQALEDLGLEAGKDVIVVGTVCNGARELLENGAQYGTTVQSPFLEGQLAIQLAAQYIKQQQQSEINPDATTTTTTTTTALSPNNTISERIFFTPNPITTNETWDSMFVDFRDEVHTVDELCTWSIFYERVAGPTSVDQRQDICSIAVDCEYVPQALFAVGYSLVSINYVLALAAGILLYLYRNKRIVKIAQPFFLTLVIVGTLIDNTSIVFMSRDGRESSQSELDAACKTWPILLSVGHMMTTATLVAKIYRVKILLNAGANFRRVEVTVRQVSMFILLFVSLDAVVIIIWYSLDPIDWSMEVTSSDLNGYISTVHGACTSDGDSSYIYPLVLILLHMGVLVYANVLAYQTSAYHKLSDSKSIAIALFNSIQLLVIAVPILALVGDNVATSYLIRICFVFLNNFGVLCLIVLPKMWQCVMGNGDIIPDLEFRKSQGRQSFSNAPNQARNVQEILSMPHVSSKSSGEAGTKRNGPSNLRSSFSTVLDKKSVVRFEDEEEFDPDVSGRDHSERAIEDSGKRQHVVSWSEQLSESRSEGGSAHFTANEKIMIPEAVSEGNEDYGEEDTSGHAEVKLAEPQSGKLCSNGDLHEPPENHDVKQGDVLIVKKSQQDESIEERTTEAIATESSELRPPIEKDIDPARSVDTSVLTPDGEDDQQESLRLDKTDSTHSALDSFSTTEES